jgi:hypothetical protein
MDFSKLPEWLKLSPRYLFPIALVTGFVLLASTGVLEVFGLAGLVEEYRPYLGVAFLLSSALLLTNWLTTGYEWVREKRRQTRDVRSKQKRLLALTDDEKRILRSYIGGQTRTQYLSVNDGVVSGLEIEHILFKASSVGHVEEWAYNLEAWAWDYLNQHSELLASNRKLEGADKDKTPPHLQRLKRRNIWR